MLMDVKRLHDWNVTPYQAIQIQRDLADKVSVKAFRGDINFIAGVDCAFYDDGKKIISCAVLLEYPDLRLIEYKLAHQTVTFPYIPGLLSFREAPCCLEALSNLSVEPSVLVVDGQGIAHPRGLGLACHIGLLIDAAVIGCAKSRLCGQYEEPGLEKGDFSYIYSRQGDEIGVALRTRKNVKPVFVSVGNNCSMEEAREIVLRSCLKYRLPEPTRLADRLVGKNKKNIENIR